MWHYEGLANLERREIWTSDLGNLKTDSCAVPFEVTRSTRADITSHDTRARRAAPIDTATHAIIIMPPSPGARDQPRARKAARARLTRLVTAASGFYAFLLFALALTALAPRGASALAIGEDEQGPFGIADDRRILLDVDSDPNDYPDSYDDGEGGTPPPSSPLSASGPSSSPAGAFAPAASPAAAPTGAPTPTPTPSPTPSPTPDPSIRVEFVGQAPKFKVYASDKPGDFFKVSFGAVQELDAAGDVVQGRSIPSLASQQTTEWTQNVVAIGDVNATEVRMRFDLTNSTQLARPCGGGGPPTSAHFTEDSHELVIIVYLFTNGTTVPYGNGTLTVPDDAVKFNVEGTNWPFCDAGNSLRVEVEVEVEAASDATVTDGADEDETRR